MGGTDICVLASFYAHVYSRDETRREAGGRIYNIRCVYVLQIGGVESRRN